MIGKVINVTADENVWAEEKKMAVTVNIYYSGKMEMQENLRRK